jgi:flagellar basal-body rod protein FlgF
VVQITPSRHASPGKVFHHAFGDVWETQENQHISAGTSAARKTDTEDQKGSDGAMDNTLLVSLSSQLASYRSMDVIANNIANINTAGFKRDTVKFEEYIQNVTPAEGEVGAQAISFVADKGTSRDLTEGAITRTNAPFDMSINGKGYFTINTPNGPRYTRNGHFALDQDGRIVTEDGNALQGDGGDLTVTTDDGDIHIAQDGTVTGIRGQIGKVQLVSFDNESALVKEGDSRYITTQTATPVESPNIQQGTLEESNVKPVVEISKMLEVLRAYQTTASLTESQQELERNAIDKLAETQS